MNKSELIQVIAESTHCSPAEVKRVLASFFDQIVEACQRGDTIRLRNIGTFARQEGIFAPSPAFVEKCLASDEDVVTPEPSKEIAAVEAPEPTAVEAPEPTAVEAPEATAVEDVGSITDGAFAELRGLLASKPNARNWKKVLSAFRNWPLEDPQRELALAYAREHIAPWPDKLRSFAIENDDSPNEPDHFVHPCPSLIASLHLTVDFRMDPEKHTPAFAAFSGLKTFHLVFRETETNFSGFRGLKAKAESFCEHLAPLIPSLETVYAEIWGKEWKITESWYTFKGSKDLTLPKDEQTWDYGTSYQTFLEDIERAKGYCDPEEWEMGSGFRS